VASLVAAAVVALTNQCVNPVNELSCFHDSAADRQSIRGAVRQRKINQISASSSPQCHQRLYLLPSSPYFGSRETRWVAQVTEYHPLLSNLYLGKQT
jgi:hypothetical protein